MTILAFQHIKSVSSWQGWIVLLLLNLVVFPLNAQRSPLTIFPVTNCPRSEKQADTWYFGEQAGIEFPVGGARPLTNSNVANIYKSPAIISDSLGNLLFFTDAKSVWDRNFNTMSNASSLEGSTGAAQSCIIIPQPGSPNLYYIFTVDILFQPIYGSWGLKYSIVDMNLNNGLGNGTTQWNISLLSAVCEKLTAVYHRNGKDVWVIVHKWDSDEFCAFLLDSKGVSTPVISHAGDTVSGDASHPTNAYGYMKAAPDGSKLALAISGMKKVELYDFDNSSGKVTNPQTYTFNLSDPLVVPVGIEFSQDSRKVYTTVLQPDGSGPPASPSRIYQFDPDKGWNNPQLIDSIVGVRMYGLQLATDGRIYVSRTVGHAIGRKDSLDVIYNPTRPGLDCNYSLLGNVPQSRFSLGGRKSIYGLPNFLQSYFYRPIFTHDSVCHGDVTRFDITNKANIDNVFWDFGDGSTSNLMPPVQHTYAQPGNYKVMLTESFNGKNFLDSAMITIYPKPVVNLGDTILVYSGSSVKLHAGGGFTEYLWSTGSADSIITVDNGGNYFVRVQDIHCCYNTDSVYVNVFKFYIPTAFAPDGVNKIFQVISAYKNISLMMYIYDRWGQLIFQSNDINKGWDGTMNGQKCMPAVYAWKVFIDFLGDEILTNGSIVFNGTVTLVR